MSYSTKNRIEEHRIARGLSQSELARKMGISPSTVSRLESGDRKLTEEYINMLARALNVAPNSIVVDNIEIFDRVQLISLVGSVSRDTWRRTSVEPVKGNIPVIPDGKYKKLSHSAFLVEDDHIADHIPAGGYAICVPMDGSRGGRAVDGDLLVVRSLEGRMERFSVAKARVDQRGVYVELDGEYVELKGENLAIGLVVSSYYSLT